MAEQYKYMPDGAAVSPSDERYAGASFDAPAPTPTVIPTNSSASLYYPPSNTPTQTINGSNAYWKNDKGDVFRTKDNQHVTMGNADPTLDWNKLGLNIDHINLQGPAKVIGGAGDVRSEVNNMGVDIENGLAEFGVKKPTDDVSTVLKEMQDDMDKRREQLAQRDKEDTAAIDKSFANTEEQLKISQEEEMAKMEGRTRIGGFITQFEQQDILKAARLNRLEVASLQAQRQSALQTARRAYQDQDYQVARDQLTLAKDIEKQTYDRQQDYFNNVIKYKNMSTPLKDATEALQKFATQAAITYASGFKDLQPADWLEMTPSELQTRIQNSDEYKKEIAGEGKPASYEEYEFLLKNGSIPKGTSYVGFQRMKATQYGTEGSGGGKGSTVFAGVNTSDTTLNVIDGVTNLDELTPTEKEKAKIELRKMGFYSSTVPAWFKKSVEEQKQTSFTPAALSKIWEATRNEVTKGGTKSSSSSSSTTAPPWTVKK